ncbi:4-hydroxy-tetrahydrodipicolinate synthase [Bacillaceae bacterium SIJ1]|uniref:4-hydroxy-tetrahydrodipicolinate synthase n=1 Tax=Litoribacterium kuwaitense TaxID=1398745 RepID=UPI0013EE228E|nr:4-hydroxy-tetrahydrodipicolinate synthase [Litoribacterium kuwaitense]NGP43983.1 4-hydroxy-tetrahydrodipicolinate synthase [Litoribacterium kuwaitense]
MYFGQLITAMVTPFTADDEVDIPGIHRLVNHLIENGSDAIVACGTTGESPVLSEDEKQVVLSETVLAAAGRIPVIAGTGSNNTAQSIQMTKKAAALGVQGIMLVAPYYNKPSQEGLYQHFRAIAEATSLPVMLYNVPGRTASNLSAETLIRLAQLPNIVALKEASDEFAKIAEMVEKTPHDFHIYTGEDHLTLPAVAVGCSGAVSVASHLFGPEMKQMLHAFFGGQPALAGQIHRDLVPRMNALFSSPNPVPLKAAMYRKGLPAGNVRLPLVPLNEVETDTLMHTLFGPREISVQRKSIP